MIKHTLKRGYNALFNGARHANRQAIIELGLPEQIADIQCHVNNLKNGATVQTGEFEALTRLFTGQKIYVDTRDISVAPHLMLDGHWEPEITTVFRRHIQPDAVVFDVGANFGYFGLIAGTHVNPNKGQIHFFEANPTLTPYIFKTLSVNGLLRPSQIVTKAVSDKAGTVDLVVLEDFWGSSGIGLDHANLHTAGQEIAIREKVNVPTITLDTYAKENKIKAVDVIKMDIEGHEETAYKGMRKLVAKSPNLKLFLEFTNNAYKDAKKFFGRIHDDFGHVYAINNQNGKLTKVSTYAKLQKLMRDDWIMLLASKKPVVA